MSVSNQVMLNVDYASDRYVRVEVGVVDGSYDDGTPKFRFGFTAQVTVDAPFGDEPRNGRVQINHGAIGSMSVDDMTLRVDIYKAAVGVGRALEKFLANDHDVSEVYDWMVEGGNFLGYRLVS